MVAVFAGVIGLARYYARRNNTYLLVGVGFLAAAILMIYAGVLSTTLMEVVLPHERAEAIAPWCFYSARLVLAVMLLASARSWRREEVLGVHGRFNAAYIYVTVGTLVVMAAAACTLIPLPPTYDPVRFIPRPQEVITGVVFGLALASYLRKGQWRSDAFDHWLILYLIIAVLSQLALMWASAQLFDPMANLVRVLSLAGHLCVVLGLLISMYQHFVTAEPHAPPNWRASTRRWRAQIGVRQRAEKELRELAGTLDQRVADRTAALETSRRAALNIAQDAEDSRRRAERAAAALGESEARTRAVLDTVLDGIITIEPNGRVATFNPGATRIFGYQPQEIIGHNVRELMPPPYQEQHDQYLANYTQTGIKKIIGIGREVVGRRRDGSTFPMDLAVAEMKLEGRPMFVGVVRDITQRRHDEQALRAPAKPSSARWSMPRPWACSSPIRKARASMATPGWRRSAGCPPALAGPGLAQCRPSRG